MALDLPYELQAYDYDNTIVIIDLPGVESIQYGLQLFWQVGLQPIPMFNAVVGQYTDGRTDVVDNKPIIDSLAASAYVLNTNNNPPSPYASFLLDYNRDNSRFYGTDVYDNRWNITANDMPDSQYLQDANVKKVLYITKGTPHNDIAEILSTYKKSGLDVQIYQNGNFADWTWDSLSLNDLPSTPATDAPHRDMLVADHPVRRAFNAIFAVLALLSILNFFTQWNAGRPLFWSVPGAQWLIYDLVPETIGDVFLILFTAFNVILWFGIAHLKSDKMLKIGLIAFLVDLLWFFIYVINYGPMAFAETPAYAVFAFGLPLLIGGLLLRNFLKYRRFLNSPTPPGWYHVRHNDWEQRYWDGFRWTEQLRYQNNDGSTFVTYNVRTRPTHVRVSGYGGYGGTGRGGYGPATGYSSMGG